jgi:hypothetical protein
MQNNKEQIQQSGNKYSFEQNEKRQRILLETKNKILKNKQ